MPYIAYLDCRSGIHEEMLLGALFDVGLSLDTLKQTLTLFPFQNYDIFLEHVADKGVRSTRATIAITSEEQKTYTLSELETLLASIQIPVYIRNSTLATLRLIADAEAIVRGEDTQAFVVSISVYISIASIIIGLKELGITQLYASALPLTSGPLSVSYSHIAMPTPITVEILRRVGATWKPSPSHRELVTLTAAALLAALVARFDTPTMTIERVGYGLSTRSFSSSESDGLYLYLGTLQEIEGQQHSGDADTDWVTVLSTNVDNMSGELLGALMERLFAAGALDVTYTPMQMKKNRPATMLMVVCPLEKGNELAYLLLRETTTLGVRIQQVQRLKAQRTSQQIDTPLGPMLIKVKRLGSQIISASPEYEECQRIAKERNMPLADVYAVVQQRIAKAITENLSYD